MRDQHHLDTFLGHLRDDTNVSCAALLAGVITIRQHQLGSPDKLEIPSETLLDYLTAYGLAIVLESLNRKTDIKPELPTLENVLALDRMVSFYRSAETEWMDS